MLRLTFWILLVANVVMFAATQTYTDVPKKHDEPQQPVPVEPEKVRLLPSALISPQSRPAGPVPVAQVPEAANCLEIGEFDAANAKLFENKIKSVLPTGSFEKFHARHPSSYMVYLPAAQNKKAAEIRIAELQKKGISNYFLITNGKQFKHAISLGIFKHEETAKNLVAQLHKLGFEDSDIHVRTRQAEPASYRISHPDSKQQEQLDIILAGFPQASKNECIVEYNFAKNN